MADEAGQGITTRRWCRRCGLPVSGGLTPLDEAWHTGTGAEACADGQLVAPVDTPPAPREPARAPKPTVSDLGIDADSLSWERSGAGDGSLEVAMPEGPWERGDWVLVRVAGAGLVSVFDRFEWECFLDGARNGEFDGATA